MVKYSGIIQKVKSKLSLKSLFVISFLILFLLFVLILNKEKTTSKGEPQRYKISSSDLPRFKEVYLDPFEFNPEEEQIVSVKIENPKPIDSVKALIKTDNLSSNFELKLASGSATSGTWIGFWKIKDTINHTYRQTFKAFSSGDESQIDLTFK